MAASLFDSGPMAAIEKPFLKLRHSSAATHQHPAREQFLDIAKRECVPGVEPDRIADDFRWEAVALKRNRFHPATLPGKAIESHRS